MGVRTVHAFPAYFLSLGVFIFSANSLQSPHGAPGAVPGAGSMSMAKEKIPALGQRGWGIIQ